MASLTKLSGTDSREIVFPNVETFYNVEADSLRPAAAGSDPVLCGFRLVCVGESHRREGHQRMVITSIVKKVLERRTHDRPYVKFETENSVYEFEY